MSELLDQFLRRNSDGRSRSVSGKQETHFEVTHRQAFGQPRSSFQHGSRVLRLDLLTTFDFDFQNKKESGELYQVNMVE